MKKTFIAFFIFSFPLLSLENGRAYDFMQKNGQNVLAAELLEENETTYTVRLAYLKKPILIEKTNLATPPTLSAKQPPRKFSFPKMYPHFSLHLSLGMAYPTFGPIAYIFKNGFDFRAGADWLPFEKTFFAVRALSFYTSYSLYLNSPRRIELISGFLGPKFFLYRWETLDATLSFSSLAGLSNTRLKGYTFEENYFSFTALGIVQMEKRFGSTSLALQLYINYLFDTSLPFVTTGLSVAVYYPLVNAPSF